MTATLERCPIWFRHPCQGLLRASWGLLRVQARVDVGVEVEEVVVVVTEMDGERRRVLVNYLQRERHHRRRRSSSQRETAMAAAATEMQLRVL